MEGFPVFQCLRKGCDGWLRPHISKHLFRCDNEKCHNVYIRKDNKFLLFRKKIEFDKK